MRRIILFIIAALFYIQMSAQTEGGVKGVVVNRMGRLPVEKAVLILYQNGTPVQEIKVDVNGRFFVEGLSDGVYSMVVTAPGFVDSNVNITVEGYVKDMMFVSLVASDSVSDVDDSNFAEFDMDDSGYNDTPSIMFDSNDPFVNIASYDFSAIRFRSRGYNNEAQDVYLSGIKMNDALTGYSPYSLWSGLNEATRSKESTIGVEASEYGVGGFSGVTNINAMPSSVRPGWRFSAMTNSALYRIRLMATYASGERKSVV